VIAFLRTGCSATHIESAHFGSPADIERAIRLDCERRASEGGGRCFNPHIDGFTKLTALEARPDRVVVHGASFTATAFGKVVRTRAGRSAPVSPNGLHPGPRHRAAAWSWWR
jgi:hypothetical protein